MPSLDRTFCSGLRCGKANTCYHWVGSLTEEEKNLINTHRLPLSIAQLSRFEGDGSCDNYTPKDRPSVDTSTEA